jgi:hypothetical protein
MLRIEGTPPSDAEFNSVRAELRSMPPAYTAEQIARAKQSGRRLPTGNDSGGSSPARVGSVRVDPPSAQMQQVRIGSFLRLRVPANWRQVGGGSDSVTFAPQGGYYESNAGQSGFTHGVQVGVIPGEAHSHQEATDELLDSLARGNPQLRRQSSGYVRESVGGRTALTTTLSNVSEVTGGTELISVSTVPLRDGSLLYLIGVSPRDEADVYSSTFRRVKQSAQISDSNLTRR